MSESRSYLATRGTPRWWQVLAYAIAGAIVAAACGAQAPTPSASAAASAASSAKASAAVTASAQPVEKLSVNWNLGTKGIQYSDIYVAIEKGFFSKRGITVTLTSSSTPTGTLLLSGAAQISSGQPTFTYVPDASGADLVGIYSPAPTFEVWVAKPPITSAQQLAGKTIGVFSLQDLDVVYTKQLMQEAGVKPDGYTLLAAGTTNNKLAAVVAGQVAAAPLYPPANFAAKQQGLNEISDTSKLKFGQVPTFYEVRASWAKDHVTGVVNILRALNEAHAWLFDKANRTEALQIIVKNTSIDQATADQSYDLYFSTPGKAYTKSGEWDANVVKKVGDELVTMGLIKAPAPAYETTVAPQYLEQALKP